MFVSFHFCFKPRANENEKKTESTNEGKLEGTRNRSKRTMKRQTRRKRKENEKRTAKQKRNKNGNTILFLTKPTAAARRGPRTADRPPPPSLTVRAGACGGWCAAADGRDFASKRNEQISIRGGYRPSRTPPAVGLRPPMVDLTHDSWVKPTIGGRRPTAGGVRGGR